MLLIITVNSNTTSNTDINTIKNCNNNSNNKKNGNSFIKNYICSSLVVLTSASAFMLCQHSAARGTAELLVKY